MTLTFNKDTCTGCMLCLKVCSFNAIEKDDDKVKFNIDNCVLCGSCVDICPVNAIKIERKAVDKEHISEFKDVWIICEVHDCHLRNVSYELVSKASELANELQEKVVSVLIGSEVDSLADSLIHQGADEVIVVNNELFTHYTTDAYTIAVASLIATGKPNIVLFGATGNGRDLAPRVAARLGLGLTADCTGLNIDEEGQLVQVRPAFGGNIMAEIICPHTRPQMATVRPNVFKPCERDPNRKGKIETVEIRINPLQLRTKVLKQVLEVTEDMKPLEEAEIIISSGRGIQNPSNLNLSKAMAKLLDGTIGGSRPIIDAGWLPHTQQVGQSGRTVCPKIYFALGISGAVQHMAGMRSSDLIVAINKDPKAAIFQIADFGIVGDLFAVVPEIIEELQTLFKERQAG